MKWYKILFHVVGLSLVTASAIFMALSFYLMHVYGKTTFCENILWVRYTEFSFSVYSVLYTLHLFVEFVWKRARANDETVSN
jgi:hypothetical protein